MTAAKYSYRSGWCGGNSHQRCSGVYAGTPCTCSCHSAVQAVLEFVPDRLPSPARLLDPAPLLQAVWLGTEVLAVSS